MPGPFGETSTTRPTGDTSPARSTPRYSLAAAGDLGAGDPGRVPRSGNTRRIRPLRGRADSYSRESTNR